MNGALLTSSKKVNVNLHLKVNEPFFQVSYDGKFC